MKRLVWLVLLFFCGCATTVKETPLQYDPKTGTYKKVYSTGELGSGFVKSLLGVGDNR